MAENAETRKQRATVDRKRTAKGNVPHEVGIEAPSKQQVRVSLPLVRSKQPGTVALDNARIFEIVPFP
jgi:hypothetical protein